MAGRITLVLLLVSGGCDYLPAMPQNPFRVTPTVADEATPTVVAASPTPLRTATPVSFTPYWVKNHRPTEMWSGPSGQAGVISFGKTSDQFCSFQVMLPQNGARLFVMNPFSRDDSGSTLTPSGRSPRSRNGQRTEAGGPELRRA